MNIFRQSNDSQEKSEKLRNFDLSVDEIKLVKSIDEMTKSVKQIEQLDPQSSRIKYMRMEIKKIEERLEELRENTLIR